MSKIISYCRKGSQRSAILLILAHTVVEFMSHDHYKYCIKIVIKISKIETKYCAKHARCIMHRKAPLQRYKSDLTSFRKYVICHKAIYINLSIEHTLINHNIDKRKFKYRLTKLLRNACLTPNI